MGGYLVAKQGALLGLIIAFKQGSEWILGRDPRQVTVILEDPLVSKKQVICRRIGQGFTLENLTPDYPVTRNGKTITEKILLKEGDVLKIGTTSFQFTEKNPNTAEKNQDSSAKWLLKALSRHKKSKKNDFPRKDFAHIENRSSEKCWKDFVISKKNLQCLSLFLLCLACYATSDLSLSRKSATNERSFYPDALETSTEKKNPQKLIENVCREFPEIKFFFDKAQGKLFLHGYVDTIAQKQKLSSILSSLFFIKTTEDHVINKELLWQKDLEKKMQPFSPYIHFSEKIGQSLNNLGMKFLRPIDYSVEHCTQIFTAKSSSRAQKMITMAVHAFTFVYAIVLYEIGDAIDRTGDFLKKRPYNYLSGKVQEKNLMASDSFSLISANLSMLPYGIWASDGLEPPEKRIDALTKKILQTHCDFVCLQEIAASHANAIWNKIQNHYAHGFSRIGPMPTHRMNNGLFFASKHPIEKTLYYSLPKTNTIDRGLFCAKTRLGWILVGNLQAGKSKKDVLVRKEQVACIRKLCDYLSEQGTIPCLLAMDSNIERLGGNSDEYTLSEIPKHFENGLYSNTSFSLTPEKATCTNTLSLALKGKKPKNIEDAYEHTDYILSYKPSSHLLALKTKQISTFSRSEKLPLSDHNILLAKAKLSKQFARQLREEETKK